jgi:hypothetical protein
MSHFATIELKISDQDALVKAIKQVYGWDAEVASNAEGIQLDGWYGNETNTAHVVIRRSQMGDCARADIGFIKGADGNYSFIGDDYAMRQSIDVGQNQFTAIISREYAKQVVIKQAQRMGAIVNREGDNLRLTVPNRQAVRR